MDSADSQTTHKEVMKSDHLHPQVASRSLKKGKPSADQSETLFENPFSIEDLMVFDDPTLRRILSHEYFGLTVENVARSMQGAPISLIKRIKSNLPSKQRSRFMRELRRPVLECEVEAARRCVLDSLFWELTYWKTPEFYEELVEGEQLHPGIFQQLEPDIKGNVVLDAGAGSGRATFECMRYGAKLVYAVEPSPGLLKILEQKLAAIPNACGVLPLQGGFEKLPLEDDSVDVSISCSAFSADPEQGGERGLAELRRVTKAGGKIVIIWPRVQDYAWLKAHGFHYVALPIQEEMQVHFRSLQTAIDCARRFYAHNRKVVRYILKKHSREVPFSVLGFNPPRDYFWLCVE